GPFGARNNGLTRTSYQLNDLAAVDPLGRPHSIVRPDDGAFGSGRTVQMFYGPKVTTTFDAGGPKSVRTVDTYGRTVRQEVFDSPGSTTAYSRTDTTYDGAGRVLTTQLNGSPDTTVTHTYDMLGRKLTTVDPDSSPGAWTYKYDAAGNLIFQNDPKTSQH